MPKVTESNKFCIATVADLKKELEKCPDHARLLLTESPEDDLHSCKSISCSEFEDGCACVVLMHGE